MSNTDSEYIVGKFDKITFEDYEKSMRKYFPSYQWRPNELEMLYDQIRLPERSSKNISGYDFFAPFGFNLRPGNRIYVPTGVYVRMDNPWMLISSPSINQYNLSISLFIDKVSKSNEEEGIDVLPLTDNEGHVILVLSIPITQSPNFHGAISKFGRDLRMVSDDVKFNSGDKFARATFLPYGIVANDKKDEDDERVDETRIIENFVWSEELYPGSTNPGLDGMKVVVLIINDGTNTTYTFASIKDTNIDEDKTDDNDSTPDTKLPDDSGDNTENGTETPSTGIDPDENDPETGDESGTGPESEIPDPSTGDETDENEGNTDGDNIDTSNTESGSDTSDGENATTEPDDETGNETEITDPDNNSIEEPITPPDNTEEEPENQEGDDENETDTDNNPESGEYDETNPDPEGESNPDSEPNTTTEPDPITGEENNEEQEPTENVETPVEDDETDSESEQEGEL